MTVTVTLSGLSAKEEAAYMQSFSTTAKDYGYADRVTVIGQKRGGLSGFASNVASMVSGKKVTVESDEPYLGKPVTLLEYAINATMKSGYDGKITVTPNQNESALEISAENMKQIVAGKKTALDVAKEVCGSGRGQYEQAQNVVRTIAANANRPK